MIKGCIFDFDGVLMDSEKYHHLGWVWVAETLGTTISYEEYAPFKSAGRKVVIPYLFEKAGKELTEQEFEKYSNLRSEMVTKALSKLSCEDIMEGVVDFLKLLKSSGIRLAVASQSTSSQRIAKEFGLFDYFDAFVDGNAGLPAKPNPHIYLKSAELLGLAPEECAVFEDSLSGVKGAKNAGMLCIGFQTYFTDIADKIIDSFVGLDLSLF